MPDTGPSDVVELMVRQRDGNECRRCHCYVGPGEGSIHHRQARQMGGTKRAGINDPANLALLCGSGTTGCHGHVESFRTEAYEMGWLVHSWEDPAEVPWHDLVSGVTYLI